MLARLKKAFILAFLAGFILYDSWQIYNLFFSPRAIAYPAPLYNIPVNETIIKIYGATQNEAPNIALALSVMTPEVRKSIKCLIVRSTADHFTDESGGGDMAHCHGGPLWTRTICIRRCYLNPGNIWHESAHALTYSLSSDDEWLEIAGDVYGRERYPEDQWSPCNGLLSWYSAKSYDEDIAEFTKFVYKARYEFYNVFRQVDKNDPRYLKKLKFLLRNHYISKADYDFVVPFLLP